MHTAHLCSQGTPARVEAFLQLFTCPVTDLEAKVESLLSFKGNMSNAEKVSLRSGPPGRPIQLHYHIFQLRSLGGAQDVRHQWSTALELCLVVISNSRTRWDPDHRLVTSRLGQGLW